MNKDYQRIAQAIEFIDNNTALQPSLQDIAAHLHLSPHHFHRMFVRYCGVTPKQFLQVLTVKSAKAALDTSMSIEQAVETSGLSGNSRLYDHFVTLEAVTPGEYKSFGEGLVFSWGTSHTHFGQTFICWNEKGIHSLEFVDTAEEVEPTLTKLQQDWKNASFVADHAEAKTQLNNIFYNTAGHSTPIKVWARGTNFQIKVWQALLSLPSGSLTTYQHLASKIEKPKASRAVGTAVGKNPVAFLIPCHRVIKSTGVLGQYRWSAVRKKVMLACEATRNQVAEEYERCI